MTDVAAPIVVQHLGKKFSYDLKRSLWYGLKDLAGEMTFRGGDRQSLRDKEFWALQDVSFELVKGETLGIVGHNGAGKSTLLKLLNGLMKPDTGRIGVRGRIGALIELGAGFSPILTGRENIYINGSILGIPKREIDLLFDGIVEFAGLENFIDTPVQSYSSGMRVRLGFSIAVNMKPDILLVDEVLSVGDSSFRERSYRRLSDLRSGGTTVIFVSHNSTAIETVCDRVLMLERGRVIGLGDPKTVVRQYEESMTRANETVKSGMLNKSLSKPNLSEDLIELISVGCYDKAGTLRDEFSFGEPIEVRITYKTQTSIESPYFSVGIKHGPDDSSPFIATASMLWDDFDAGELRTEGQISCSLNNPQLASGTFTLVVGAQKAISGQLGEKWYARPRNVGTFSVLAESMQNILTGAPAAHLVSGIPPMVIEHSWAVSGLAETNLDSEA